MNQQAYSILIIDDEPGNVESLGRIFQREGFEVDVAYDGQQSLEVLRNKSIDIALCDVMMPQFDGLDLLKAIKAVSPYTQVIMISAYGTIDRAVEAMRRGAYDFVSKPLKRREIVKLVHKALETSALIQENQSLREQLRELEKSPLLIGQSAALRHILSIIKQVAQSPSTVLIQGASGTGKELVAREIHRLSSRGHKKFIALNCSAFPETLFDSEMFGYEKGAFTGANTTKQGRFELANGGTLFLDEIGELAPSIQVKLLRVLQERQIERLGGTEPISIDIRLIAATNKDLNAKMEAGNFREDLFYRLNVIKIDVPTLSERREDIPILAQHFLNKYAGSSRHPSLHLTPETVEILQDYAWPGNVRELENAMERSAILASGPILRPSDLPPEIYRTQTEGNFFVIQFGTPLDQIERVVISETLRRTGGDKKIAAQLLGVATRTIYRKIDALQQVNERDSTFPYDPDDDDTGEDEHDSAEKAKHEDLDKAEYDGTDKAKHMDTNKT